MDSDSQGGELTSKLELDVKALTLLYRSDEQLGALLRTSLLDSHDEGTRRFVNLLQRGRESGRKGAIAIAVGEMVLASVLAIAGLVAFIPNLVGLSNPAALMNYFTQLTSSPTLVTLAPVAGALEFALAVVLILGALYTLRQASVHLRRAGFVTAQE